MSKKQQSILEKFPKTFTAIISAIVFSVTLAALSYVMNLNILQDHKDGEKYSLFDKVKYSIRCHNKRHIKLRENRPNLSEKKFPSAKYETLEHKEYLVRTDKDGIIEPAFVNNNPDLQIFFIGGSTTECETVDEQYRFPYLSGRLIEEKTGLKVNSDNAARSGNNSLHSINILINKLLPYKPDMVVMMHNVNDLSTLVYEGSYWNVNKTKSPLSCAYKNTKQLKKNDEWGASVWQDKILKSTDEQNKALVKFEENLKLFTFITRSQNIIPVLMTQPNRIEDYEGFDTKRGSDFNLVYQSMYKKFNQKIRDFGRKNNILVIDLANFVPQESKYIYDSIHINKEGSMMVSNKIAKDIASYLGRIKFKSK